MSRWYPKGGGSRPDCVPPLLQVAAKKNVLKLISVLNSAFDLGLSTDLALECTSDAIRSTRMEKEFQKLIAVVGGSHAGRLADQLLAREAQVCTLTQPGWRVSKSNIEKVVGELLSLSPPPDVIVLQCLDNSSFFCQNEDGSLTLPTRALADGKFHLTGDLKVASKDQTVNLVKLLVPLLKAVPDADIILITCIPRFMYVPCCNKHCKRMPEDTAKLKVDLCAMKRNIRSQLFCEKLGAVKIIDPVAVCETTLPDSYSDSTRTSLLSSMRSWPRRLSTASATLQRSALWGPPSRRPRGPGSCQDSLRPDKIGAPAGGVRGGADAAGAADMVGGAPGSLQWYVKIHNFNLVLRLILS